MTMPPHRHSAHVGRLWQVALLFVIGVGPLLIATWAWAYQSGPLTPSQPGDAATVPGCPEPGYIDALAGLPPITVQALTTAHCRYEAAALTLHSPESGHPTPDLYTCARGRVCHLGLGLWYAAPHSIVVDDQVCRAAALQRHRADPRANKAMGAQLDAERAANPGTLAIDEACGLR